MRDVSTQAEMIAEINAGNVIVYKGRIIRKVSDVPNDAQILLDYPQWFYPRIEGNAKGVIGYAIDDVPVDGDALIFDGVAKKFIFSPASGGGSSLIIREVDGTPSIAAVSILEFHQADGFVVSNPSGTIARVNITSIPWVNVSKTGSSLADLTTRNAADLTTGTLLDARLSSNVTLGGNTFTGTGSIVRATSPSLITPTLGDASATSLGIGLGATATPTTFTVGDSISTTPRGLMSWQSSTDTASAHLHMRKSRGTFASPSTIVTADVLGRVVFAGYEGTSYIESAYIRALSTGTVATTRVPTKLEFYTGTDVAPTVATLALTLAADQSATFAGILKAGTSPTTLTDSAGKVLSVALNTVQVAQGGTALTALGSALQVLRVNAGGTALEFAAPPGSGTVNSGTIKRVAQYSATGTSISDAPGFEYQSAASPNVLITAQNASYVPLRVISAASPATDSFQVSSDNGTTTHFLVTSGGAPSAPGSGSNSERFGAGSALSNSTNTVALGQGAQASTGSTNAVVVGQGTTGGGTNYILIGQGSGGVTSNSAVGIGQNLTPASSSITIGKDAVGASASFVAGSSGTPMTNVYFGKGIINATAAAWTLNGVGGSGSNNAGGNLILAGGISTGSATPGSILFQVGTTAGSSSTPQTLATKLTISETSSIFNSTITTGSSTTSGLVVTADSLTTGTGVYIGSTSTAGNGTTSVLFDVSRSGAQTGTVTTTTGRFSNTATGASATNVALTLAASGATTANYALLTSGGAIAIGGTSSSFPAIFNNGANINFRKADNSSYTNIDGVTSISIYPGGTNRTVLLGNGDGNLDVSSGGRVGFSSSSTNATSVDTTLRRAAAATLALGATDVDTAPVAQSIQVQNALAGGTSDVAGANWTFKGSQGKGTGAGGSIIFQTAPAGGSSGTTVNSLATALTISGSGTVTVANSLVTGGLSSSTGTATFNQAQITATNGYYWNGRSAIFSPANGAIQFQNNANSISTNISFPVSNTFQFGLGDATSAVAQTISVQNVTGASDTAGANWTFKASAGTGTGAGGSYIWQVAPASTTGSTQNTFVSALTLDSTSALTQKKDNIGSTSTDGIILQNTTAAAAGAQQWSPRLHWVGSGWKTTGTASQTVDYIAELQPVQGTTAPSANWALSYQINGGGYSSALMVTSGGVIGIDSAGTASPAFGSINSSVLRTGVRVSGDDVYIANNQSNYFRFSNGAGLRARNDMYIGFSLDSSLGLPDALWTRGGVGNIRSGLPDATTAVNQTRSVQNVTGATNIAGATTTEIASLGTSQGAPGRYHIKTGAMIDASGSTQQTAVDRLILGSTKVLTNNSAITVTNITVASNTVAAGKVDYAVEVFDGTDLQIEEGSVYYHLTNKGGTIANNSTNKSGNQQVTTSGTLSVTWTITAANPGLLQINVNSSLTPNTGYPRITYSIFNLTQQVITPQ